METKEEYDNYCQYCGGKFIVAEEQPEAACTCRENDWETRTEKY